jgi:cell division protein FtsL
MSVRASGRRAAHPLLGSRAQAARMPARPRPPRSAPGPRARARRPLRWLRVLGWAALMLASLLLVTWRQTVGLELERGLAAVQADREIAEAEAVELVRRIEELRSRARVVRVARDRLGMHLPDDHEIVFLASPVSGASGEGRR